MNQDNSNKPLDRDVLVMGPETQSGGNLFIRHKNDHSIVVGEIHPVEDGKYVHGEIINLSGEGPVFDVETVYDAKNEKPSKVNTKAFQEGWDAIFGNKLIGQA